MYEGINYDLNFAAFTVLSYLYYNMNLIRPTLEELTLGLLSI